MSTVPLVRIEGTFEYKGQKYGGAFEYEGREAGEALFAAFARAIEYSVELLDRGEMP